MRPSPGWKSSKQMLQPWQAASSSAAAAAAPLVEPLLLPLPLAALPLVLGVSTAFVFDQMDGLLAELPAGKENVSICRTDQGLMPVEDQNSTRMTATVVLARQESTAPWCSSLCNSMQHLEQAPRKLSQSRGRAKRVCSMLKWEIEAIHLVNYCWHSRKVDFVKS